MKLLNSLKLNIRTQFNRLQNISKLQIIQFVKIVLFGLLLSILTFPNLDWTFSSGIDPSLVWVFNNLNIEGLSNGSHIIFPHGPLAFFMYPLPENVILVMIVIALLKILLLF